MPASIAGRCAVFAESDIIHKQQMGVSMENILAGMCRALVRNYMSNVARAKNLSLASASRAEYPAMVELKKPLKRKSEQKLRYLSTIL